MLIADSSCTITLALLPIRRTIFNYALDFCFSPISSILSLSFLFSTSTLLPFQTINLVACDRDGILPT